MSYSLRRLVFTGLLAAGLLSLAYLGVDLWRSRQYAEYKESFDKAMDRVRAREEVEEDNRRNRILGAIEQARRDDAITALEVAQRNYESNALLAEMKRKSEQDANEMEQELTRNMDQLNLMVQQGRQQQQIDEIQLAQSRSQESIKSQEVSQHLQTVTRPISPSATGYNSAYPSMIRQQQFQQQQNQIQEIQQQQQYDQQREMMRNQGWGRPGVDGPN